MRLVLKSVAFRFLFRVSFADWGDFILCFGSPLVSLVLGLLSLV